MGLLNNAIPFSLILWAQSHVTSSVASILNATTPLFAVLVAHAALPDEPASARKIAGVLVGLAGVALMMGSGADMLEKPSGGRDRHPCSPPSAMPWPASMAGASRA